MKLVFLGAPGAGKGTMAVGLAEELSIAHISTGDLFRANISGQTELGLLAKKYLDEGVLVPDEVTIGMVRERLADPDCGKAFILDGFPRTVPQAEALDQILEEMGSKIDAAVNLEVPEDIIFERITNRLVCSVCGRVYNKSLFPPQKEGICDYCGGKLIQRADDTAETLRVRLDTYYDLTAPLISFYLAKGILLDFDNSGKHSPEKVRELILAIEEKIKDQA